MTDSLTHRGPDDRGTWVDMEAGVALGNRRLAILDLSAEGRQPMVSADGRYVLAFNGEIYNFGELRRQLESVGVTFRGGSDTEVLLEAVAKWGVEAALARSNGMFALAVWDRRSRAVTLARDRFGEKPLYFGVFGGALLFGSELRALRAHPDFRAEIDRDALAAYLRLGCFPAPTSVYVGVSKLPPGSLLRVVPADARLGGDDDLPSPRAWWSARAVAEAALGEAFAGSDGEAADELQRRLRGSVGMRMVSDVPLGAFLSGGIDSSTVVALLQEQSTIPVRTFTIGLAENDYDEAANARAIARHLGTDHTELYFTPAEARAAVARLPSVYDEPFADSSQLPTLLVSELARRHVTVVLSGDGGDELFGGYNRHVTLQRIWEWAGPVPKPLRAAAAALLRTASPASIDRAAAALRPVLPPRARLRHPGEKTHKLAAVIAADDPVDAYSALVSAWPEPSEVVVGASRRPAGAGSAGWSGPGDLTDQVMALDTVTYLPDDQLTKLDRASMSVGLEARVPMLDPAVFELAWRLPRQMKVRNGSGKWLLRQVLARYVPPNLTDRPKSGFAVPVREWLRGPLRSWAEDLLSEPRLRATGILDPGPVRQAWSEHLDGRFDHSTRLWSVLMFEAWRDSVGPT